MFLLEDLVLLGNYTIWTVLLNPIWTALFAFKWSFEEKTQRWSTDSDDILEAEWALW